MPFPGSCLVDLSAGNTRLENLWERRDSTSSTLSSVYTLSRRSSSTSPCHSSRRSSQASQVGANRPNNLSSADSYDPISADMSRRSSQVSQFGDSGGTERFGGLAGPLSLTPAQHYHLKAKYAAATGGPPPTPLPHMDQTGLSPHTPAYHHSQDFTAWSLMPHEVPADIPRRASDPVKPLGGTSLHQPQMQRYNSLGTLIRGTQPHPPSSADRQHSSQNRHLGMFRCSPQPRRISQQAAAEAGREEKESLVRFHRSTEATSRVATNQQGLPTHQEHQRRMALSTSNTGPAQQRHMCPLSGQASQTDASVQSNQVSLEALSPNPLYPPPQAAGNMAVLQPIHNVGSFRNNLASNRRAIQNLVNVLQQTFWQTADQRMGSRHRLDQRVRPHDLTGNFYTTAAEGNALRSGYKREQVAVETVGMSYADAGFQMVQVKTEDGDGAMMTSDQQELVSEHQSCLHPRPPTGPKAQTHPPSRATQPPRHLNTWTQDVASSVSRHGPSAGDSVLRYTGQIHVFEPAANLDRDFSPMLNISSLEKHAVPPGVGDNQGAEHAFDAAIAQTAVDFDSMLDDRSSLLSGALSPALLQDLSQSSSRLTTPRTSVTLPSPPAATANMAIGDMSSLLSTLAEESKMLNLMA